LVAVGEIGIDRSIMIPIEIQTKVFEIQLIIAQTYNLPVIIHSVKAYSDIIHCITKCKITIPIIIHGYYGNNEITSKLLTNGFFFSFGKQLMLKNKNALSALKSIPLERMFFETDDEHYVIQSIYQFAAKELNLSVKHLKEKIGNNYTAIFNIEIVKK
jgi:TatD DNase family protein